MTRTETKPPVRLSTGRVVRHYAMASGATSAEVDGPDMSEAEWQEYCELMKARTYGNSETGVSDNR